MKRVRIKAAISMLSLAILLALLVLSQPISAAAQDQPSQLIEMTAKKYEFSGSPLHIKKGTKVQLKVTAADHDHGVKLPTIPDGAARNSPAGLILTSAQECWKIKKGESAIIEFIAQTPGTYSFKCCVDCGMGHRHMKGQIIVDE